jgi:glycosyltransferase involved in cell wall biosynthesis/2-polyprenyl-3-methyl-5-hydroxy-6-metoxy-1,4-benzoquinol methylase
MIDSEGHHLAFLLGLPRSGTTLLSVILDRHPQVLCPPEPWIMLALESVGKVCIRHPADSRLLGQAVLEFADDASGLEATRAYATTLYNRRLESAGKLVFVDKTPRYYHILPYLRRVFREAKWIWLQRNPLDVAASYKTSWDVDLCRVLSEGADHPAWSFDLVIGLEQLLREADASDPRVLSVRYEQLVAEPQTETARVMRFLELEPMPDQTQFDLSGSAFAKSFAGDKKIAATAGPHAQSVGTWKSAFKPDELQTLFDFIGADTFCRLGYCQTVDELKALGVKDNGPHATADRRAAIHQIYAQRWADVLAASRADAPLPWVKRLEGQITQQKGAIDQLNSELAGAAERNRQLLEESNRKQQLADQSNAELTLARSELDEKRRSSEAMERHLTEQKREASELRRTVAEYAVRLARAAQPLVPWRKRFLDSASKTAQQLIISWPHGRRRRRVKPLPRISIVTPVYNGESHIRETIESVLSQEYPKLQYIIVDGGSTDGTLEIVNEYKDRISRIISEPDNGMYDAIGKGFEAADGEILGYLNADDLFEPGGLIRVGEWFRDHPRAEVVYHEDTVWFDGWKFPNAPQPPRIDRLTMLKGHTMFQDGVFFRRRAYQSVGGVNRQMRRAGDWDLWVRLSGNYRMHRAKPHVSCFRIRPGQISQDLASYHAELEHAKAQWKKEIGPRALRISEVRHWMRRGYNLLWQKLVPRPLYYPLHQSGCIYGFHPTPGTPPPYVPDQPRCPLTGARPDRALFSSRDTRFGDELINYIYYCSTTDIALTYPPLSKEQLNALYEKHYSKTDGKIIYPPIEHASPYKNYRGGNLFDKLAARSVIPSIASQRFLTWEDETAQQVLRSVRGLPRENAAVDFLDVGCFEGKLLSSIAGQTDWRTFGLEANGKAVEAARSLGHQIWQGFAEDATFVIPEDMFFDVIHLGQTLEHFVDPLTVIRRLRALLKPGGRMVLSTPNLWSQQVKLFGPTWAHWHPPYHRHIFSRKSLAILARRCDMEMLGVRSYSHIYWTCLSVQLNRIGCGGAVPHTVDFPDEIVRVAASLTLWSKLFWDWRGRGDYLVTLFRKR